MVALMQMQTKYVGNAVEVNMSRVLCEALVETLSKVKEAL